MQEQSHMLLLIEQIIMHTSFSRDGQQLSIGLHLLDLPGQLLVRLDGQSTALSIVHQCLLSRTEGTHQRHGLFSGQVELSYGGRVGDGVPVDAVMTEGTTHALLFVEGREDLLVAVDDVLNSRCCTGKKKYMDSFRPTAAAAITT